MNTLAQTLFASYLEGCQEAGSIRCPVRFEKHRWSQVHQKLQHLELMTMLQDWLWSYLWLFLLQDFLCQIERYCRQCHLTTPITFPPEHPVEEVGRLLLCCLLKHEDLGMNLSILAIHKSFNWHISVITNLHFILNIFHRSRGIIFSSCRYTWYWASKA